MLRTTVLLGLAALMVGCSHTRLAPPAQPVSTPSFLDLQPGWRLRVVAPILQSGASVADLKPVASDGQTITLSSSDFVGYETTIFRVDGRRLHRLKLVSAELNVNGAAQRERKPLKTVLQTPEFAALLRLLYLRRVSTSDHDMALLAAPTAASLESLTASVQHDPASCRTDALRFCFWVPKGVAAIPEKPIASSPANWEPAL